MVAVKILGSLKNYQKGFYGIFSDCFLIFDKILVSFRTTIIWFMYSLSANKGGSGPLFGSGPQMQNSAKSYWVGNE